MTRWKRIPLALRRHPLLSAVALLVLGVLGFGYWHARAHGYLYISLSDVSERERPVPVMSARVSLLDASKTVLARFDVEPPYGTFALREPADYACVEDQDAASLAQRARAWRVCHERHSRWLMQVLPRVAYADIDADGCAIRALPVSAERLDSVDWLLWWVPLPHMGGKPYTHFNVSLYVNRRTCTLGSGGESMPNPSQ